MKLKTLLIGLALAATNAMADYITVKTQTSPSAVGGKEIYFGTIANYTKSVSEIASKMKAGNAALNGLSTSSQYLAKGMFGDSLKASGTGIGIGLAYGLLNPYIMSYRYDQEYILVRSNGNGELTAVMFIGDKNPSMSEDQIHEILRSR